MRTERVRIEGTDFLTTLTLGAPIGLLALHGGVEGGTAELATEVAARTGATLLTFTQPTGPPAHIPSIRMSACAPLRTFLSHATLTISLHGHNRGATPRTIYVGGSNRPAARVLAAALADSAFTPVTSLADIPPPLRGLHPENPVNQTRLGGVQLELPVLARTTHPAPTAPEVPPEEVVEGIVAGVGVLMERGGAW
ncbi:poly-gamma-glutamate hydrolase family protein [Streptomyces sp. NBC_00566]|uniref:poly-gamma-glutamate hydrolase family protein n=1 Tax=Streptomyces sp. NBC_00566 TaxID=2975778 RepID=UPI002E8029A4|nr:poly-gamma-glutamate hydrolase family protein [Streptomyces sp. NBC_00566]WUB87919.1 poly-gamma-glutamate hydrolase family protein [Streptomyces sp. NBC_00566]